MANYDESEYFVDSQEEIAEREAQEALRRMVRTEIRRVQTGAADADIAANGGVLNGFAISPQAKAVLLGAVDGSKRPLFINSVADGAIPMILGARTVLSKGMYAAGDEANIIGVAGDWTQALYGTVEGVRIDYSSDACLVDGENTISLFQNNMFAVRAEIEVGFRADTDCFNVLTAAPAASE